MTAQELVGDWILIKDAASDLKCSKEAIFLAIRMGYITGVHKVGTAFLIPIAEWERYKRERRSPGRPRREERVEAVA